MMKTKRAHLWIGLIASLFILMESITGLLMNEPWLIGQSQTVGSRGDFQPGQFNQGAPTQGTGQTGGQTSGQPQANGQTDASGQTPQTSGQASANRQFPSQGGPGVNGASQGSFIRTIKNLHQGMIGNTNVKWLLDLAAIAMILLTSTGIYLSCKVLGLKKEE